MDRNVMALIELPSGVVARPFDQGWEDGALVDAIVSRRTSNRVKVTLTVGPDTFTVERPASELWELLPR